MIMLQYVLMVPVHTNNTQQADKGTNTFYGEQSTDFWYEKLVSLSAVRWRLRCYNSDWPIDIYEQEITQSQYINPNSILMSWKR